MDRRRRVPLPLGDNRYLTIVHTGHRDAKHNRFYTLDALVLDLSDFDPAHPERVVISRLDRIMIPETRWEIEGPCPDSVGNVLFSCGAFEREGEIYVIYGGGDTYVMAAQNQQSGSVGGDGAGKLAPRRELAVMRTMRISLLALLLSWFARPVCLCAAPTEQLTIGRVELMPNNPEPFEAKDSRAAAADSTSWHSISMRAANICH